MQNLKNEIQIALNAFKSGKISKAKKLTEELLVANPNEVFLYNLLGLILSELKKIDQAIECYNKGLKIDSTYSMLYNNIAQLLFSYKYNGNQKKIEEYFKKSISLNKKIPEPHNNLGNFYKANN